MDTKVKKKSRYTIDVKDRFQALQSNEDENSDITIYNIIQAHREAAELYVPHKPRNKKSLWEGRQVVEKRCALQSVLKGTSEGVHPKASKLKMPQRILTELTPKNRRNTLKVRYRKLNVFTSPKEQI